MTWDVFPYSSSFEIVRAFREAFCLFFFWLQNAQGKRRAKGWKGFHNFHNSHVKASPANCTKYTFSASVTFCSITLQILKTHHSSQSNFLFKFVMLEICYETVRALLLLSDCGKQLYSNLEMQQQCNKLSKKAFFSPHALQHGCICHHTETAHTRIYPQLFTLNKNTKCIHQCSHIFCLLWQLFNSYSSPCKWADSLPLPIVAKWYELLNINDWEWLIDPPTRRPPQTDRNPDICISLSLVACNSRHRSHSLSPIQSVTGLHIKNMPIV